MGEAGMKLGRANERALYSGRAPLIQQGATIKSGRSTYRVLHVRGSTVTVEVIKPWHKQLATALARAAAAVARRLQIGRPTRPAGSFPSEPAGAAAKIVDKK